MIIRQQAFTGGNDKFLKGGLHCHTTRSDGQVPPDEVIRLHAEHGYDFLALTDHRFYNYTNFAPETNVLIVPGMEIDVSITSDAGMCFHTVAVGPAQDKNGYAQDERVPSGRVADAAEYQPYVDALRQRNNLAIYCHPDWSRTPARSFENIKGCFAMEIWNSGCALELDMDTDNGLIWDELLQSGRQISCVAVDDGHKREHHCKGWVMVDAEKRLDAILSALEGGRFYSSCGPEIYDFYVEDDTVCVRTSPAAAVKFMWGFRPSRVVRAADAPLTEASAKLNGRKYVRAVVIDKQGRKAWTNPIYLG
ncbi:MAG: CehA/McbA family metallohydrolase [Clostridia bacterium]|nr:CehA/McbA family metallohydrolase [Clostridia bacterium]